ncbi:MAG: extracellular solute-binding protein [Ilumatobacteraceae bacterium]
MTTRITPRRALAVLAAAGVFVAACSSGESALTSGEDEPEATEAPAQTEAPTGSDAGDSDGEPADEPEATDAPAETEAPTTTVAPLAEFPPCPVDALDAADGPVDVLFWHSMTNELETALIGLTDEYNASQDRVRVELQNQTSYESTIDKYIQSSQGSRPTLVQLPEYTLQSFAESGTAIPVQACIEAAGFDTSALLQRTTDAYTFEGVQWSMPFNVSNPVLYYNRKMFVEAGLDPEDPPISLEDMRDVSQQLVDSGAATYGWVVDSGTDSGGAWFLEQWFGRAGELYSDNGNGRLAPSTEVLFDSATGVELLTFVQEMIDDGLAFTVGDNPGGLDAFLKLADENEPGAMTIGTSAGLGTVIAALGSGIAPDLGPDDVGVGPMPGPGDQPAAQVGGASLWLVAEKDDAATAAAWDYVQFLVNAQSQSTWAAATGYAPIRSDALDLDPLATQYAEDPRFRVPYDQLTTSVDDVAASAPVLGPQREVRDATANAIAAIFTGADVATALADAADEANALIRSYNDRN